MKQITQIITGIILALGMVSCEEMNERVLPSNTGKPGDLLVVIDSNYFNHRSGEALRQVFAQQQVGLPQMEPLFNLIQIPHSSFGRIFYTTRNIILININSKKNTKLSIRKEVWANAQLVITITAPSDRVAAETIRENETALLDYFNDKELSRLKAKYRKYGTSINAHHLTEKFELSLSIDELYKVAGESEDFIWYRKEKSVGGHLVSQGILIYTYPYISDSTFDRTQLVAKRDHYTKEFVAGGAEGSYMKSFQDYVPNQREVSLNGVYVNELRGLWHMEGDFMGGPYVNYTMVDEQRNRVVCIDGYVFAPKFDKREYLRELEGLIKTITF